MSEQRSAASSFRPTLRRSTARVRVPATSANLGPGYDALGLALELYDDVSARILADGVVVDVRGEGADSVPRDDAHLVVAAIRLGFEDLGAPPTGIALSCTNRIPHGRGLGSSAAAIVAGLLLARALVVDGAQRVSDTALLGRAADIEGHPDNVAACLLGGLTVSWSTHGVAHAVRVDVSPSIAPVAFVPPGRSVTAETRRLLPAHVPHADAAFSAGRAALLVAALTSAPGALLDATDDVLHQPYRRPSMPESAQLVRDLRARGIPAAISGAGPTVLALTRTPAETELGESMTPAGWQRLRLAVDGVGARLVGAVADGS